LISFIEGCTKWPQVPPTYCITELWNRAGDSVILLPIAAIRYTLHQAALHKKQFYNKKLVIAMAQFVGTG
jgi:hypothetical protein